MDSTKEQRLLVSFFPSDRWVMTGRHGKMVTSESDLEKTKQFSRENDTSPSALARATEFTWSPEMFQSLAIKNADGDHLFTDRGTKVSFDRAHVTNEEIRSALLYAQQKFGKQIKLDGDDRVFSERMARLADDMGLTVLNPELQSFIHDYRAAKAKTNNINHSD